MKQDLSLLSSDSDESDTEDDAPTSSSDNSKRNAYDTYDESNAEEDDTVSQSLTNNSNELAHKSTVQFMELSAYSNPSQAQHQRYPVLAPAHLQIMATNHYHQHHHIALPAPTPIISTSQALTKPKPESTDCLCYLFSPKRKNALFCLALFIILLVYNGQNLFLYSLSRLQTSSTNFISYCAFEESYADYYVLLTQLVVPLTNLCLFSLLPLLLCTMQVLFDVCFLVRVQREQMKRYLKLKDIIEWPLYVYYAVYMISQLPFAIHQINDLIMGTVKFPFVFPLFIQLKFSSKVWLAVFEMSLMCVAYSSDFFIWIACDKDLRQLAKLWLNKRILCRTYAKPNPSSGEKKSKNRNSLSTDESNSCGGISSSNRSDLNSLNHHNHSPNIHKAKIGSSSTSTATTGVPQQNQNSYASSTLSSTSSLGKKKSISPNITESIKATAAISASLTHHNDIYSQDNQGGTAIPIRMIDTDNEDIEGLHESNERYRLDKLDEGDESKKFSTYKHASLNSNPPSFKSAISKSQFQSHGEYKNPYQNDFDLNIHPTAQPKVQNY